MPAVDARLLRLEWPMGEKLQTDLLLHYHQVSTQFNQVTTGTYLERDTADEGRAALPPINISNENLQGIPNVHLQSKPIIRWWRGPSNHLRTMLVQEQKQTGRSQGTVRGCSP